MLAQQGAEIHTSAIAVADKVLFSSIHFLNSGSPLLHQPLVQLIFNLNSKRWVVYFTFRLLYTQGRRPSIYWIGSWVAPRAAGTKSEYLSNGVLSRKHWIFSSSATRTLSPASALLFLRAKYFEKPILILLTKECWVFLGTQSLIIDFTRSGHWFLFWAKCIQSRPSHPVSIRHVSTV